MDDVKRKALEDNAAVRNRIRRMREALKVAALAYEVLAEDAERQANNIRELLFEMDEPEV